MTAACKLLILGASGFIGSRLMEVWPAHESVGTFFKRPLANCVRFDIANERLGDRFLRRGHQFTHAVLAHGVTKLGQCALMPDLSAAINVFGTTRAIDDLLDAGVHPIFLSSDCVFDGSSGPRSEEEAPCPILSYGRQKVATEAHLLARAGSWTILRLSKVVGSFFDKRSLLSLWLEKVKRTKPILCAADQTLTPVDIDDVVRVLCFVVATGSTGLYHVAGSEAITRHALLLELLKHVPAHYRQRAIVNTCRIDAIPSPEPLPHNCTLKNDKLKALSGFAPARMAPICSKLCSSSAFPQGQRQFPASRYLGGELRTLGAVAFQNA